MICDEYWRRSCSAPLRPTQRIFTALPSATSALIFSRARRTIEELNAPHSPRSAVQTTRRCTWLEPVPARSFGAELRSVTDDAMLPSTFSMRSA